MAEIVSFISGCLFTILLSLGCMYTAYKALQYKEDTEVRREDKRKKIIEKNAPPPDGDVIRPKTYEELALERDEYTQTVTELLQ